MKDFLLIPIILIATSPQFAFSQPVKILVIPYGERIDDLSYKDYDRCRRFEKHVKCLYESESTIPTSLDIDY